jgi:hypothetical protein
MLKNYDGNLVALVFLCITDLNSKQFQGKMYALRSVLRLPSVGLAVSASLRHPPSVKSSVNLVGRLQGYASESGSRVSTLRRVKPTRTLKETLMAPAGETGPLCLVSNCFI